MNESSSSFSGGDGNSNEVVALILNEAFLSS